MYKSIMIAFLLFFSIGCQYDKKELRTLDGQKKEETVKVVKNSTIKEIAPSPEQALDKEKLDKYELEKLNIEKDMKLTELEIQSQLELAKIDADKEKHIKELESKSSIEKAKIQKDISMQEQESVAKIEEKKIEFYKIALIFISIAIALILIVVYIINRKNRHAKLQMQQEEINKEKTMQDREHHHQKINKMLDIISSKDVSENIQKDVINLLKDANKDIPLIEDKTDKS